ncbi:hypothetical protein MMC28_011422 [Mycoblastus sanguinarius]|nr:hypothetical protein [Mycoblastus sanguinarius]
MVVDDDYNILGVIDWEDASSVPWEVIDYPLNFSSVPKPMRPPEWYDEYGVPKIKKLQDRDAERKGYVNAVREMEKQLRLPPLLSDVLADKAGQDLASALHCFTVDRVVGKYTKVLDAHQKRYRGDTSNAAPSN